MSEWKDGLPPVGDVVEFCKDQGVNYRTLAKHWDDGDDLEVLSHKETLEPVAVVWNIDKCECSSLIASLLRPKKTEEDRKRDRAVGEMERDAEPHSLVPANTFHMKSLYDAGYRKVTPLTDEQRQKIYEMPHTFNVRMIVDAVERAMLGETK